MFIVKVKAVDSACVTRKRDKGYAVLRGEEENIKEDFLEKQVKRGAGESQMVEGGECFRP